MIMLPSSEKSAPDLPIEEPSTRQPRRYRRRLLQTLGAYAVFVVVILTLHWRFGLTASSTTSAPSTPPSPQGQAKTLAPSNYTVVRGIFRQDEDGFDGRDYDLLKDGFGLLDKSAGRWHNFSR